MGMLVKFSPELSAWILHNLDRGCAVGDLVRSMVAQKFEPELALGLVAAFARARREGVDPPSDSIALDDAPIDYLYETPRLPPGPVIRSFDREIEVVMRLHKPALAVLAGVLSADECAAVIALSRDRLRPSTIVDPLTGQDTIAAHRSSEGMFFRPQETPFIAGIERRIAELMNCPIENGEGLQVLHYAPGAHSAPHFDFLAPSNPSNRESLARSGQRVSSLVVYLNDVPRGGETVFPEVGLAVSARAGNAVHFEYANSLHQVDHRSVHAGAAVDAGDKWVLTKWMRERRFVSA